MQNNSTNNRKLLTTKTVFTVTIMVFVLTIVGVWLFGLGQHKTIFENSIRSAGILSLAFFLFLSIGLYKGIKLKDDLGNLTDKLKLKKIPNLSQLAGNVNFIHIGEGIEGVILSVVLWLVVTILIAIFFWLFGAVLWTGIILFVAMLYWIFFRALRLVFKNANKSKGNLKTSVLYGLGYAALYVFWIYALIFTTHYLVG